jgi:RNA polymerase sigma factor for flagellar operon FliA
MSQGERQDVTLASPPQDESTLWRALRTEGSTAAREILFSTYASFARQIATRHFRDRRSGDIEHQDLCQLAFAGLLEAIDRFDPDRGLPFRGYASRRISGSILDGVAKMSEMREQISFRNRMRADRVRSLTAEALDDLSIAEAMQALSDIVAGLAVGFMLESGGLVVADGEPDRRPTAYESLAWKDTLRRLGRELEDLPDRDRAILRHHYLDSMTFEQIGALLGLSKGRISQLHRSALGMLRRRLVRSDDFTFER